MKIFRHTFKASDGFKLFPHMEPYAQKMQRQISFNTVKGSSVKVTVLARGYGSDVFEGVGASGTDIDLSNPASFILEGYVEEYKLEVVGSIDTIIMTEAI